jgi:hypothetical protein
MPDYTSRADEMLKEIEAMQDKLPAEAPKKLRDAAAAYLALRKSALDDLLKILEDASTSTTNTANAWRSRCDQARSGVAAPFEDALKNVVMPAEAAALGYGWQMSTKVKEEQFFSTLCNINAAAVRDYMVNNQVGLKSYTQTLDEKWRRITSEDTKLQDEEQKLYQEMLETTKRITQELAEKEKTVKEQAARGGQVILKGVEKTSGLIVEGVKQFFGVELPEGTSTAIEKGAEMLGEMTKGWLEANAAIQGRISNYRSLVQAEKGGILPLFRETRKEVAEYWDRNGVEKAKGMLDGGKSSLESWLSGLPTSAQKDDAKRFYDAAYKALEDRFKEMEAVASEFEKKWNGVFKGALATSTIDELVESAPWRMNAKTLAEIGTPALVNTLIKNMDGYYEESFDEPLNKLADAVSKYPEAQREDARRAVEAVRKSVEASIRDRIKTLQEKVAQSLNWFDASALEKTFDRGELKDSLE